MAFWKINYAAQVMHNNPNHYNLNMRVAQNQQAHSILKTMKFHLGTRKMDVFEVNSRWMWLRKMMKSIKII